MRRVGFLFLGLLLPLLSDKGHAQTNPTWTKPAPLTAIVGTQTLVLTTSPQGLAVPSGALLATLSVTGSSSTTAAANYTDAGNPPTATTGLTLPPGLWTYKGPLASILFILPSGVTGTVITVGYYK